MAKRTGIHWVQKSDSFSSCEAQAEDVGPRSGELSHICHIFSRVLESTCRTCPLKLVKRADQS